MSEKQAKSQLRKMVDNFTPGTVLHFFGEVFGALAEESRKDDDPIAAERHKNVECALFVIGLGVDAACPR